MKRVLKTLGQTLSQSILLVCILALIGLAVVPNQPVYAASIYSSQTPKEAKVSKI